MCVRRSPFWSISVQVTKSFEQLHFEVKGGGEIDGEFSSGFDGAVRWTSDDFPVERNKKALPIFLKKIPLCNKTRAMDSKKTNKHTA